MEVTDRFFELPTGSFFLFGPRGTGKSTILRRCFPDALFIDLLHPERLRELAARPERLFEVARATSPNATIVIDEIQKCPPLLDVVHALIEEVPARRFVLTGSSARKLKRAGVDLLAGRAVMRTMHPFMAAELGARFELEAALRHGLVPLVVAARRPSDVLRTYAALYLREEVQLEGLVRNVGNFARFLEVVSFSHAQLVNVAEIARECAIERKVVAGYLEILEDLLLAFRLPVFTKRARRETSVHPKLYLFDAGVYRSLRPQGPLDRPEEIAGAALEGLVAQHLRAWLGYRTTRDELSFWRTRTGQEVDFVLYGDSGFFAVEVKHAARVRPDDIRALRAFSSEYPESRPVLLHRGSDRFVIDGVLCLPVGAFLSALVPTRPFEDALGS